MTALNGFCSFVHSFDSLYWERICSVMAHKASADGDKSKIYCKGNLHFSLPFGGSFAEEGKYICVFTGGISNCKTLKEKLLDMGIKTEENFASVFLNIYKSLGARGIGLIFGEFCSFVWDSEKEKLLLFKDKAGTKSLYYAYVNKRFVFSSSVNGILRFPGVYAKLSPKGIYNMLENASCLDPFCTAFEDIKRIPPGSVAEFTGEGVKIKCYCSLNPADKFNSEFIARDAIRIRGGKEVALNKATDKLQTVISALDSVDVCGFPAYPPVYAFLSLIKTEKEQKLSFPFLPPEFKVPDFGFLLKDDIIKEARKNNYVPLSVQKNILGMSVYFDDEIKRLLTGRMKLKINTCYPLWWESFDSYSSLCQKEITLPLADGRFLECVADGGGENYIYNKEISLPDCDYVRKILLNELSKGKRTMFAFLDSRKVYDCIFDTDSVLSLLYILQLDYWSHKLKVTL